MATNNANNTYITATANNEVTMPSQPAFLVYNSVTDANQTGNGVLVTIDFDTEVFDQNNDFAADTFTAPVTGRYVLTAQATLNNIAGAASDFQVRINTSNRIYTYVDGAHVTSANTQAIFINALCDMDAADTAIVEGYVLGEGANTIGIFGNAAPYTFFSGNLEV